MRLLRLEGCGNCRKGRRIAIDVSDASIPTPCCAQCPWTNGIKDENTRFVDSPISYMIGKLCIEHFPSGSPLQSPSCGQFDVNDFGGVQLTPGPFIPTIKLRARDYHDFEVEVSLYEEPWVAHPKAANIHEATIPHLAWQAIDIIRHCGHHTGHRAVQRGSNGATRHWVYLEGYFHDKSGRGFKSRWQVKWSV